MRDTHVTKAQPVTVCYQQIYGNSVDFFCNKRLAHDHLCAYERRILLRNIKARMEAGVGVANRSAFCFGALLDSGY